MPLPFDKPCYLITEDELQKLFDLLKRAPFEHVEEPIQIIRMLAATRRLEPQKPELEGKLPDVKLESKPPEAKAKA